MKTEQKCPRCGQALPQDAPAGHCPKFVLELAMDEITLKTTSGGQEVRSPFTALDAIASVGTRVKYFGDYELIERLSQAKPPKRRGAVGLLAHLKRCPRPIPVSPRHYLPSP